MLSFDSSHSKTHQSHFNKTDANKSRWQSANSGAYFHLRTSMTCGILPFKKLGAHDSLWKSVRNLWSVLLLSCLGVKVFTEKAVAAVPLLPLTVKSEGTQIHYINDTHLYDTYSIHLH